MDEALRGGRTRGASTDNERQVAELMVLQAKVKEMGIQVSDDAVGKYLRENFKDPSTGVFNYDAFIQNLRQRPDRRGHVPGAHPPAGGHSALG